jgi:hypothetical protein
VKGFAQHLVDSMFTSFFTLFSEDGDKSSVKTRVRRTNVPAQPQPYLMSRTG